MIYFRSAGRVDRCPGWTARAAPPRTPMVGRFCRVEPLDPARHAADLFAANSLDAEGRNWTYLFQEPFRDFEAYRAWLEQVAKARRSAVPRHRRSRDGQGRGRGDLHAHRPRHGRDRGRQHQLFAAAAEDARRDRGHVPDDGARVRRARLPALRVEVRLLRMRRRGRRRCGWASSTRGCSGRRWSTRAATATPAGSPSSTANGRD